MVGDAAGFGINTGLTIRGIDMAIVSGIAAANAVIKANSISEVGPKYMQELENLQALPNQRAFAGWHKIFELSRLFDDYPKICGYGEGQNPMCNSPSKGGSFGLFLIGMQRIIISGQTCKSCYISLGNGSLGCFKNISNFKLVKRFSSIYVSI